MPESVDKLIDDLYAKPLAEFTAARDALVRKLRKDGEKAVANRVKELRKPTVSAWAINQLVRKDRMRIRSLLVAGEKLRSAHAELLGGGRAADVREAADAERNAINHLVSSAERILADAGHSASASALERVATTLRAAAVDEEGRAALEQGRLTHDLDPTGFGPPEVTAKPRSQSTREARRAPDAKRREKKRRQAAEERLQTLRAELREAGKSVAEADRNVAAAERNLRTAEREARDAQEKYKRVERRLQEAESDLEQLRRK